MASLPPKVRYITRQADARSIWREKNSTGIWMSCGIFEAGRRQGNVVQSGDATEQQEYALSMFIKIIIIINAHSD